MIRKIFSPLLASSQPVGYRVGSSDTRGIVESLDATSWSYNGRDARETADQATSKRIFWRSISSEICLFLSKRPREPFFVPWRRLFHASYEVFRELHMKFPFKQLLRTTSYEIEKFEIL